MGNSTSTKLTKISKSNKKSKLGRLRQIFRCFQGEEAVKENVKEANATDSEQNAYKAFHEKLEVNISIIEIELSDNVSTGATPDLRPGDIFRSHPTTIDRPRQVHSSSNGKDYHPQRNISEQAFDTRDRRLRPKAAKGNRTRPVSNNMDIYLPGAAFPIKADDPSEGSDMKNMQDRCLFEWMKRCNEAENKT
ncbi:hypothetical protein ACJMK2_010680 [Sinanodonta woodiana]|uniref:Uncharacterized protein n=1 Tax=Sinanodonta woodiana TaxID=1069815 RepID=A0ABD3VJ65_SINWO